MAIARALRRTPLHRTGLLLLAGACVGCSSPGAPSTATGTLTGEWGGPHILVTIADGGAFLQFDCAYGNTSGAWIIGARDAFDLTGIYVLEQGGPIRVGEMPDSHPAEYSGSVMGTTMTLTVKETDTGDNIGTFTAGRAAAGQLVPCVLPLRSQNVDRRSLVVHSKTADAVGAKLKN